MPRGECSKADDQKRHSTSHGEVSTGITLPSLTSMLCKSGVTSRLMAHLRNLSVKSDCHQMRHSCGTSKLGANRATMARAVLNMEPICNDLPDEILEQHVLPLLPLASLCRFRAVSKKWNDYIAHPHLAALHAITLPPPEDFALINIRTSLPFNALGGWDILDVPYDRFFSLGQDFLGSMDGTQRVVLAADGGLVLIWYSVVERSPNHALLVCNPLLKVVKVIPSLPGWVLAHLYDCVVMSTNRTTMTYEIVVFHPRVNHYQVECIHFFQSKTSTWRRVVNPVVPSQECWLEDAQFVRFRGGLYRLYRRQRDNMKPKPHLVEFDKTTGVGSIVPLQELFYSKWLEPKFLELVVSQDRLFCVCKWGTSKHEYRNVEIFEIFPEQEQDDCKLVTRMPINHVMWLRGQDEHNNAREVGDAKAIMSKYVDPVVTTGCVSSILFCSCIGRSMVYDLVGESWLRYSGSNLLKQLMTSSETGRHLECRNMGLSLCHP